MRRITSLVLIALILMVSCACSTTKPYGKRRRMKQKPCNCPGNSHIVVTQKSNYS